METFNYDVIETTLNMIKKLVPEYGIESRVFKSIRMAEKYFYHAIETLLYSLILRIISNIYYPEIYIRTI